MPRPYHERLNFENKLPLRLIDHGTGGPKSALPHWHQAVELGYVYKGHPGTVHIGGTTFHMRPQHLYVVNSEVVHSYEVILDEQDQVVTFLIPAAWLRTVVNQTKLPIWGPLDLDLKTTQYRDLYQVIQRLAMSVRDAVNTQAAYLIKLGSSYQLIGELMKQLTVQGESTNAQQPLPQPLRQAVNELQENYAKPVAIAELAASLNYSSVYFSRYFKRYLGISPKAYLSQVRLQRAAELLITTSDSIQTIALKTGFRTTKNFFVTFKDWFKMTPKSYRQRYAARQL